MKSIIAISSIVGHVAAFPWVANVANIDVGRLFDRAAIEARQLGSASLCPNNSNHTGAAPYTAQYPYCGAKNGQPGVFPCLNNRVPASGDSAHAWEKPGSKDIRGPCPGLNTAANHHFLSHDGITTFTELIDMQQNVYGVGYDLAVLLATLGVGLSGDPVTQKLSIGCDATSRTSASGGSSGELGLDGHNKFEGDTSLTRNDYFTGSPAGNNFLFNYTLFQGMSKTCNGNCSRDQMSLYRFQRYQDSLNHNGNFYYGPKSLLLYGASSFLYQLFPSRGPLGVPDQNTMNYFFILEQIPPNWYSRSDPYTIPLVANEINAQYQEYPVAFGGNTGKPNTFVGIGERGPYFSNTSKFNGTAAGVACLLYQFATENQPASLNQQSSIPESTLKWAAGNLNPIYKAAGSPCPLDYNNA